MGARPIKKPSKIINGLQDAVAYAKGDTTRATSHTVRVPQLRNAGEIMVPLHVIMNLAKHLQFEQIDGHGDALSLCQIKNAESVIREFAKSETQRCRQPARRWRTTAKPSSCTLTR